MERAANGSPYSTSAHIIPWWEEARQRGLVDVYLLCSMTNARLGAAWSLYFIPSTCTEVVWKHFMFEQTKS